MDNLVKKALQVPLQVSKAERLIMMDLVSDNINEGVLNSLLAYFPNLRVYFYRGGFGANYEQTVVEASQPHPWNNTIEHITEYDNSALARQTLASGVCPLLTNISIGSLYEGENGSNIIRLLENAPALISLEMNGVFLTLSDLDLLHENVPSLTSLSLIVSSICRGESILPVIIPASTVTKLELHGVELPEPADELALYQYIGRKYTNVSDLQCLTNVASTEVYDSAKVYYDGFMSFAKKRGSNLTGLNMMMEERFIDFIFELDALGCQIKTLSFDYYVGHSTIEKLAQSKQTDYIQSLLIENYLTGHSLDWLKEFKALKELNMDFTGQVRGVQETTFSLNELLSNLSDGLELLYLCYDHIIFNPSNIPQCPSVKTLMISCSLLPPGLDWFISQAFPNLKHLRIFRCKWASKRFSLPNLDLSYLEVLHSFPNKDEKVLVTTLKNKERRWLSTWTLGFYNCIELEFGHTDSALFPSTLSLPFDGFEGESCIEIEVNSVYTFFCTKL
jgi:hypothetical protein